MIKPRRLKSIFSFHSISPLAFKINQLFLGGAVAILLLAFAPLAIQQSGLTQAPPVGVFLDNLLPSTTPQQSTGPTALQVTDPYPNLDFTLPLHMAGEPTSNLMLVGEMQGRIESFDLTSSNPAKTTFLDLRNSTWYQGESGLLSFAFHPEYPDSNYIYVFYQYDDPGAFEYSRVSRFTVPTVGSPADPTSEMVLIHQADRSANHNGGMLVFGNDGFLYVGMGDEGGSNNQFNNAQYLDKRLFGGILRIDVDNDTSKSHPIRRQPLHHNANDQSFTANYMIPNDNPWLDVNGGYLEEFFAIGLRNPARLSLDHITGDIFIGEVGQDKREEINILAKGANYEWPFMEGTLTGPRAMPITHYGTDTGPAFEYNHSNGSNCVVGGVVYRGTSIPGLAGQYLFADNGSSIIWSGAPSGNNIPAAQVMQTTATSSTGLVAFGEDQNHNVYFINMGRNGRGKLYSFVNSTGSTGPQPPQYLSQLGIFKDLTTLEPDSFTIPYEQNVPFWSDGAIKSRFMIIPNDGNPNTAAEQIGYSEEGEWTFPQGAVLVKHFEMQIDETNPALTRRLETRLMVHGTDGKYYGLSYKWLPNQLDAELLEGSFTDTIAINTTNGPREIVWYYPNRSECLTCHKDASSSVLGLKTAQLNKDITYPSTGITANQIKTIAHLGFFDQVPDTNNLTSLPAFPELQDQSAPVEERAMAYLDANCGYCHNPNTGVFAQFDARSISSNDLSSLIFGEVYKDLGLAGGRAIVPNDLEQSVILRRMSSLRNGTAMPPLAKNKIDSSGVDILTQWISSISTGFNTVPSYPTNGLLASYAFDQNTGLTLVDGSGNGMDGTLQNGPTWNAGQNGNALSFDGLDDRVDVPDPTQKIDLTQNNALTFASWIRLAAYPTGNMGIVAKGETDISAGLVIRGNGRLRLILNGGTSTGNPFTFTYNAGLQLNTWYHIAVTFDGQDARFYINGSRQYIVSGTTTLVGNTQNLCVGISDGQYFDGSIDELFIYNRALDDAEIGTLANPTSAGSMVGQTIDFPQLENALTVDPPINLQGTTSSGLPITYTVESGPATISGNTLTLTGDSGYVVILAEQAGNASYDEAPPVRRKFFVAPPGHIDGTGLTGYYFDNIDLTNLYTTRLDTQVNFYWGSDAPVNGMQYGTYSVRWDGQIEPPFDGSYTFSTTSDDGIRLWVDGQLLIDQWQNQSLTEFSGSITLNALQPVDIRLEYFEYGAYAEVELQWSHSLIDQEVIPTPFLFPSTGLLPLDLLSFDAFALGDRVAIDWTTHLNPLAKTFVVERADEKQDFVAIDQQDYQAQELQYRSWDYNPQLGSNFYRLKQIDLDGQISYSEVKEVVMDRVLEDLAIQAYPNPLGAAQVLTLDITTRSERQMTVECFNTSGTVVSTRAVQQGIGNMRHQIDLQGLSKGIYFIRLIDPTHDQVIVKRILIP